MGRRSYLKPIVARLLKDQTIVSLARAIHRGQVDAGIPLRDRIMELWTAPNHAYVAIVVAILAERCAPLPTRIRLWAQWQFAAERVDGVVNDLIDVATGNRAGNAFERAALKKIFAEN